MEFLNDAFAQLNLGVDVISESLRPLLYAYAVYLVAKLRTQILSGVPVFLRTALVGLIESALRPLVDNAVRAAEEYGNRLAKGAIEKAKTKVNNVKLEVARQYIRKWVPDALFDDATVDRWIDAGLVRVGLGATAAVTFGIEVLDDKIDDIPLPPAA